MRDSPPPFNMPKDNIVAASGTEYCSGFKDQHGQWNNGFYCPKWGGPDLKYCCGPEDHKYCCPKEESTQQKLSNSQTQQLSLLIGLAIGSFILLLATLVLSCYFCRCCWAYKRRKRSQAGSPALPAYPGYSRDPTDPVNYAVCPHGTLFPEFMMPTPQYPSEAPPPYPGDAPALPLENKHTLPPPQVQEHDGEESERAPGASPRRQCSRGSEPCRHRTPDRQPSSDRESRCHSDYSNCNCGGNHGAAAADSLHCAVIPHGQEAGCCHDDDQSQRPPSTPVVMPGTSRQINYQIPKIKSAHAQHRARRLGAYDSRSISSSDSDAFST